MFLRTTALINRKRVERKLISVDEELELTSSWLHNNDYQQYKYTLFTLSPSK